MFVYFATVNTSKFETREAGEGGKGPGGGRGGDADVVEGEGGVQLPPARSFARDGIVVRLT